VRSSLNAAALGTFARRNGLLALLFAAFIAAYIPTYIKLAAGPWRTEQEGHGPLIMLAAICRLACAGNALEQDWDFAGSDRRMDYFMGRARIDDLARALTCFSSKYCPKSP
jgi:hypothetical protein